MIETQAKTHINHHQSQLQLFVGMERHLSLVRLCGCNPE